MSPGTLDSILRRLPLPNDPNVLVGFSTNDDAGVYLLGEGIGLVQTVDFFTPVVDNPFTFGQIAAANSLSDVYAMGGRPISALSVVGFPEKGDPAILEQIIRGGLDKMNEAKCTVIGGHSIRNEDIQFGYAVSGIVNPLQIWRNVGASTNDVLLFTKAIGTGVISTAIKKDRASTESIAAAVASMSLLNRAAAEALHDVEAKLGPRVIHAVTDVTGFGFLGHAREMALGNPAAGTPAVTLEIDHQAVPLLPGALDAVRQGLTPGGLKNNREFLGDCVGFASSVPEENRALLYDPQTSGGLLVAIAPEAVDAALASFAHHGVTAARVGRVLPKASPILSVI
ncbi:MAG TPA: selenide, water dikinase SelD [Candidatus Saccharimonadales bacterium]|nr:selenide, water dikinase SelD [Candidatus Saccharimonadales bacterium]